MQSHRLMPKITKQQIGKYFKDEVVVFLRENYFAAIKEDCVAQQINDANAVVGGIVGKPSTQISSPSVSLVSGNEGQQVLGNH